MQARVWSERYRGSSPLTHGMAIYSLTQTKQKRKNCINKSSPHQSNYTNRIRILCISFVAYHPFSCLHCLRLYFRARACVCVVVVVVLLLLFLLLHYFLPFVSMRVWAVLVENSLIGYWPTLWT